MSQSTGKKRKENLTWKLDLLEAQAARTVSNTRLVRSQFAASKKIRKVNKEEGKNDFRKGQFENTQRADMIAEEAQTNQQKEAPVEISEEDKAQIAALRRKIVEQKIYHYSKVIQKALKAAKTTEGLKITKRIKKEEGNEEKIKKLNEEQLELKSLDISMLTPIHATKLLQKAFIPNKTARENPPDFLSESIVSPPENAPVITFYKNASAAMLNVVSRLCGTAAVKTAGENMVQAVKYAAKVERKETASEIARRKHEEKKQRRKEAKLERKESEEYSQYDTMIAASSDESDDEMGGVAASEDDEETQEQEEGILGTSSAHDKHKDAESDSDGGDDFFVFPDEDEEQSPKKKHKVEDEDESKYNLPALATGYFSGGSDDEDMEDAPRDRGYDMDNDRVVKAATTQRKNRRGQQARRAIYEKKYGKNANHLKKEQEIKKSKWQERQAEFEKREARRKELGIERPAQKKLPELPEKKPLHPSWEAKKKLKASPVAFQGKKVVFGDDSAPASSPKPSNSSKSNEQLHPSWEAKKKLSAAPVKFTGKKITF